MLQVRRGGWLMELSTDSHLYLRHRWLEQMLKKKNKKGDREEKNKRKGPVYPLSKVVSVL